jgi:hypothetical protein
MRLFATLAILAVATVNAPSALAQDSPTVTQLRSLLGPGAVLSFERQTPITGPVEGVTLENVAILRDGQRGTIATLSLAGLRADGVTRLSARDVAIPTPDGPLRIGTAEIAGVAIRRRGASGPQQPDDVKIGSAVVENIAAPGRPAFTIRRMALNNYGIGQRSSGEIAGIAFTGLPDNPIDAMEAARIAFSGIELASLSTAAAARRSPGPQPVGRQELTIEGVALRHGGELLGGLASLAIEGEVNAQGSGTGSLALRGLTTERSTLTAPFLDMVGLDRLEASLSFNGTYDAATGRLVVPAFALGVREVAALALSLGIDGWTPEAAQRQDPSRVRLLEARLRYADQSLYRRAVRTQASRMGGGEQAVREQHAQIVAGALATPRPDPATEALRNVLLRFIRGEINMVELQARPQAPLPVMGLAAAAQQGPAAIIRMLGLTAQGATTP